MGYGMKRGAAPKFTDLGSSPAKLTGSSNAKEINKLEDKIESLQHNITDGDPSAAKTAVMKRSIATLRNKLTAIRSKK